MFGIDLHAAALVAVIAAVTILLRFLPFVIFGGGRPTPRYVVYLARVLPCAIMAPWAPPTPCRNCWPPLRWWGCSSGAKTPCSASPRVRCSI